MTVIAVSDIHGSMTVMGHLRRMQAKYPDAVTVFCGDYIDGHPHSAEVVRSIMRQVADGRAYAILGNHDQMLLDYLRDDVNRQAWFMNGGDKTVASMVHAATGKDMPPESDASRHAMIDKYTDMGEFIAQLPTMCVYGKIIFIHAGFDLSKADPLRDTSAVDRIWIREDYIYRNDRSEPIFAHNPFDYTLVSGHTPTGLIKGRYDGDETYIETKFPKCPILAVHYDGESPRYFIDGGVHSGYKENQGNIAVFDEETGLLLDSLQTNI
ncbi:metallophosphoesterase [Lacticaseibacillus sharpeae]|uniref:Diadenosine tetraphosphatase related serine threonine protein phosphatase n=1 Tax=Lacticaseibacillus sharpeae JCM 1186 = DSM 20505 TaxID=1291052 RepID=A0A0R1ZR14_9LACO|nr:metallophosphoesterase [Lacticaseibacillus sharpeae]KRM54379.1 Diadenosine tetraphosphatase related serine threonine protein phosphatase [Lacticaseibacillus sharpeae JCM 1186 = DSM 20505]